MIMSVSEMDSEVTTTNNHQINKTHIAIGHDRKLTLQEVSRLVAEKVAIVLSFTSYPAMEASYRFLQACIDQHLPIYGINTNFGDQICFLDAHLKTDDRALYQQSINERQENIIKSLACSVGNIVPPEIIKVTMMLRAHCLAQGYSGVSCAAVEAILAYLNAGITPIVRQYGSIGASGDLIPLASLAAGIIGEEVDVLYQGEIMKAPRAIELAGLEKFKPQLRDGLALVNGTSFMTAIASLALCDLKRLFRQMLYAVGMALESMLVISSAYHPLVHQLKQQAGENIVNHILLNFWEGSQLLSNLDELRAIHAAQSKAIEKTAYVKPMQDYYSLRAVPQGFGPLQENLTRAITWIENEMNSVNDNPIVDAENGHIHHGANFMGYYVTDACDMLKMDLAQASSWIHALLANMVHPRKSHNLPANLVQDPGKNNGFRSMQLLAAALAVQNRKLAQTHQAFMLPTEGDNQDVNSLGTHAALDLKEAVANLERLTAILLLASAQALELRGIKKAGKKTQQIYQAIRECSPAVLDCRPMTEEIHAIIGLLKEERI
jgi:histidine ammonia-lyase